jgi:predicted nuclease of predicted toxin-antitoxin system
VKVLLDMNLSPVWVPFLTDAGIEAVHWANVGDPTAADHELMAWARDNGCIVFTNDLDYSALLGAHTRYGSQRPADSYARFDADRDRRDDRERAP